MAELTDHYGLSILGRGGSLADDDYKYGGADRRLLDRLLFLGAEGHHHTGVTAIAADAPPAALDLSIDTTQGALPSGRSFFYVWTLIDPEGIESVASPESIAAMPPGIPAPGRPPLATDPAGGTLRPGNYIYAVTAYTNFDTLESLASPPAFIQVPVGTDTNLVTISLPALPAGATGFNIYRQAPGGHDLTWVATVDMTGPAPPLTLLDDGALAEDCARFTPTENTTAASNSVTVDLPDVAGVPYEVPAGWSWRLYRSDTAGTFTNAVLATISTGATTFTDVGAATVTGTPPLFDVAVGSPEKINLADGAEVTGRLPLARMSAFPYIVEFSYEGAASVAPGSTSWPCMFPQATIVGVIPVLGRGSTPALQPLIVDVNRARAGVFESIFSAPADRPRILVGQQAGAQVVATAITELELGDLLTVDVDQHGGSDPRTDNDLTVSVLLYVYGWADPTSHPWAP